MKRERKEAEEGADAADGSEAQLSAEDVISWLKRAKKRVRGKWAKTALRSCAAAFKEAYTAHQAQSQGERSTLDDAAAAIEQKEEGSKRKKKGKKGKAQRADTGVDSQAAPASDGALGEANHEQPAKPEKALAKQRRKEEKRRMRAAAAAATAAVDATEGAQPDEATLQTTANRATSQQDKRVQADLSEKAVRKAEKDKKRRKRHDTSDHEDMDCDGHMAAVDSQDDEGSNADDRPHVPPITPAATVTGPSRDKAMQQQQQSKFVASSPAHPTNDATREDEQDKPKKAHFSTALTQALDEALNDEELSGVAVDVEQLLAGPLMQADKAWAERLKPEQVRTKLDRMRKQRKKDAEILAKAQQAAQHNPAPAADTVQQAALLAHQAGSSAHQAPRPIQQGGPGGLGMAAAPRPAHVLGSGARPMGMGHSDYGPPRPFGQQHRQQQYGPWEGPDYAHHDEPFDGFMHMHGPQNEPMRMHGPSVPMQPWQGPPPRPFGYRPRGHAPRGPGPAYSNSQARMGQGPGGPARLPRPMGTGQGLQPHPSATQPACPAPACPAHAAFPTPTVTASAPTAVQARIR